MLTPPTPNQLRQFLSIMAESDQTEAHATAERLADLLDSLPEEMSDDDVLGLIAASAREIQEAAESIETFITVGKKGPAL